MQSSGITCFKWLNPALWSAAKDALLNHVQGHEAFCISQGYLMNSCYTWPRWEKVSCFKQVLPRVLPSVHWVCSQIYGYINRTSFDCMLFLKDQCFAFLFHIIGFIEEYFYGGVTTLKLTLHMSAILLTSVHRIVHRWEVYSNEAAQG